MGFTEPLSQKKSTGLDSIPGGLSERPMELVLKTSGQKCLVGSNPTPSARGQEGGDA